MDHKLLAMFIHLSETLHFAKTAQVFHVSPSTLSRQIQRLEQQIGCELLHRDNRSVYLTDAGKKFRRYAKAQQQQWQIFKDSINQQQQQLSGKLHIYCSVTAAYSHLPPLLDRFRQQHPLVEIMLTTGDAADALAKVEGKSVDFAIAAKPENQPKNIYFFPIADVSLAIIAPTVPCKVTQQLSPSHQLPAFNWSTLNWAAIPMILAGYGPVRSRFEQWYRKKRCGKPNIYATVSGHEALVSMVALGCGIGMVPEVVIDNSPVKERVQILPDGSEIPPFELGVCCLNQTKDKPLVHAFFDAVGRAKKHS